ncbi:hypothetical protein Celal_1316 [Cellulophaga algicola DSM 14237]|uniref:Lipoprotein n=1 Tax=Cellulophaga algicola (strain DSM 14237 / IC166 / ACAM 630) TaxID=688270 RepID=E6X832_CELAD|nr:hypothetical protein [Cellulophaga algicola]ADV48630.1 hypothetical protein Celal_1316 [Cellulophaga algicola DSM 14237]
MVISRAFYKIFLGITVIVLVAACKDTVKETVTKKSEMLPNGMHLMVEKTAIEKTSFGIFTNHNYGTSHRFKYRIAVDQGSIEWDFGVGEPKHFLFCDKGVYIHYLNENSYTEEARDTINDTIEKVQVIKIENQYQKYIDERYLFKLFGDAYWVDVTAEEYARNKALCSEQAIPNDNELSIDAVE